MKTTVSKIIFSLAATILATANVLAVADLSVGEFAPRDPQREWQIISPTLSLSDYGQQLNLYAYVGNDPINFVDAYGLWGIAFGNNEGSSYFNIGWGDPSLYFSPDSLDDLGQGAAATSDGLLDAATLGGGFGLFDPGLFARFGAYDPCDPTLRTSRRLGEFGGSLLGGAGALRGAAKIGGTRLGYTLNHNRYLRIGPGNIPKPTQPWQGWLTRGPGQNVPTLRIGTGQPQWWNHWDLRGWGY